MWVSVAKVRVMRVSQVRVRMARVRVARVRVQGDQGDANGRSWLLLDRSLSLIHI